MNFAKVSILGAGAIGSYVIWGLSEKKDIELSVIADGERKMRYERDGFVINDVVYRPRVLTPQEAHGTDLLIVAAKYNSLRPALPDIKAAADDHTVVMSLMNGVDSEEIISEVVPESSVIYSLIKVASDRRGNEVHFDPDCAVGIIYGEKDDCRGSERTDALDRLFSGSRLKYRKSDEILSEMWSKFRLNVSANQTQALIGAAINTEYDSEHAAFIRRRLGEEVDLIACAKGISLAGAEGASSAASISSTAPVVPTVPTAPANPDRSRCSTLQDLQENRHTEVDMFSGAVVRMGRELGIPTPYNECVYHMIKALEEKNDGKFDFG